MIWFEFRCLQISDFRYACCWWCITFWIVLWLFTEQNFLIKEFFGFRAFNQFWPAWGLRPPFKQGQSPTDTAGVTEVARQPRSSEAKFEVRTVSNIELLQIFWLFPPLPQEGPRQTAVDVLTLTPKETSPAFPPAAKPDIWISANTDRGGDFSKKRRASDPVQSSCRFATFKIIYYSSYDNYLHYFQVYQDHLGDPRLSPFCLRILRKLIPCGGGCLWPRFSLNARQICKILFLQ